MKGRRVLLVVENLPIARDHRLRKQVSALVAAGFAVTVVCRRDPANAKVQGITLRDYPAPPDAESKLGYLREYGWSVLMAAWQIVRSLASEGFDAVQVASTPDIYFVLTLPLRLLGKRVVFDARDLSPEIYERRYHRSDGAAVTMLRALERASYRSADHVLVVNDSVAQVAMERGHVPAARVTRVGNGPVQGNVQPGTAKSPGRAVHQCCWIGLMGPQDGVELALRAAHRIVREHGRSDIRFVFAGTGDILPGLEALATELGLQGAVEFPGWLDPEQVVALLRESDLGLEPNLEDFVSPVKAMEYMAYGLPVVAFDLHETRITVGGGGLFAPPGDVEAFADCIELLADDPATREKLGREGKEQVRTVCAWELQAERYVGLYRTLIGKEEGETLPTSLERV